VEGSKKREQRKKHKGVNRTKKADPNSAIHFEKGKGNKGAQTGSGKPDTESWGTREGFLPEGRQRKRGSNGKNWIRVLE